MTDEVEVTMELRVVLRTVTALQTAIENATEAWNSHVNQHGDVGLRNKRLSALYKEDIAEAEALIALLEM